MKRCKDPNKMEDLLLQLLETILTNPKYRGFIKEAKRIQSEFEALPYDYGYEELDLDELVREKQRQVKEEQGIQLTGIQPKVIKIDIPAENREELLKKLREM